MTAAPPLPSLPDALRALRPLLAGGAPVLDGPSLERLSLSGGEPPVIAACTPLEPPGARRLTPAAAPLVGAFLDGVQRSRLLGHVGHAPVIFASVAAAIRERVDRQLQTWHAPRVARMLLVARDRVGEAAFAQLAESGLPVIDASAAAGNGPVLLHPHALRARALELVALERERLERQLAAAWVAEAEGLHPGAAASPDPWLWIDGGIAGNLAIDAGARAFGVVKSHTTLYGDEAAVSAVLSLRSGERSPAFLVGHAARRAVASWYLRLRDGAAADPLFGLVRVEVAPPVADADWEAFTAHCDRLSAGILLERAPLSLPDARWDTLSYGVHAVESYLQAVLGV
ncbi:MAG: hypothetical protein K2R93_16850 [Gemmatimonadaceae bacterium]|nr:hypothetical protein [Gemmatimonadaceae bacterium]